jgi:sulfotransferase
MKKSFEQFVCLGGLPRSGSTLLSSILSQNPDLHAEGNSAVCQLMWDMQQVCIVNADEMLKGNKRLDTHIDLMASIPKTYYKDVTAKVVIDKCRSWSAPPNMEMLRKYITPTPKVIVMTRPIAEVVRSFAALREQNNWVGNPEHGLLDGVGEPLMRSYHAAQWAKHNNNGEFLLVSYAELVDDTKATVNKIYEFCEWESFMHDFDNVVNLHPEDDEFYKMVGMHDVRPAIERRTVDYKLSKGTLALCELIEQSDFYKHPEGAV